MALLSRASQREKEVKDRIPRRSPKASQLLGGRLIPWTLNHLYAMDFSPLFFFCRGFFSDAFLTVISSLYLSLEFHALSDHQVCSPKVKPQMGFFQGQCLLGGWIQWEQIDNHSLVHFCGLGMPGFNKKLFCLEIKMNSDSLKSRRRKQFLSSFWKLRAQVRGTINKGNFSYLLFEMFSKHI